MSRNKQIPFGTERRLESIETAMQQAARRAFVREMGRAASSPAELDRFVGERVEMGHYVRTGESLGGGGRANPWNNATFEDVGLRLRPGGKKGRGRHRGGGERGQAQGGEDYEAQDQRPVAPGRLEELEAGRRASRLSPEDFQKEQMARAYAAEEARMARQLSPEDEAAARQGLGPVDPRTGRRRSMPQSQNGYYY